MEEGEKMSRQSVRLVPTEKENISRFPPGDRRAFIGVVRRDGKRFRYLRRPVVRRPPRAEVARYPPSSAVVHVHVLSAMVRDLVVHASRLSCRPLSFCTVTQEVTQYQVRPKVDHTHTRTHKRLGRGNPVGYLSTPWTSVSFHPSSAKIIFISSIISGTILETSHPHHQPPHPRQRQKKSPSTPLACFFLITLA